jgi:hypothetical protein
MTAPVLLERRVTADQLVVGIAQHGPLEAPAARHQAEKDRPPPTNG